MSIRQPNVEEIIGKVRHVEISPELKKALKIRSVFYEKYGKITPEEINELPEGAVTYPIKSLYRTVSGCTREHHCQLIHYHQPLLGNKTTANIIDDIRKSDPFTNREYLPLRDYVNRHYVELCDYFPYAFQVAYDAYTTRVLSDRAQELKKRVIDRYFEIEDLIDQEIL